MGTRLCTVGASFAPPSEGCSAHPYLCACMQQLPITSLVGVMFLISYTAFEWESLLMILGAAMPKQWRESTWWSQWTIRKITRVDALCIILVVVVTLLMDLFTGVAAGIVLVSVAYCWQVSLTSGTTACDNA